MKTLLLIASGIACSCSMRAQISASVSRLSDFETQVIVRNNSDRSLTAFALSANVITTHPATEMRTASNSLWNSYQDSVIDLAIEPLLPKQERALMTRIGCWSSFPARPPKKEAPVWNCDQLGQLTTAGIYSDGSTTGDAVLLTRLMLRRSSLLMAIDTASAALSEAGNHNYPRGQLVEQFKKLVDSVSGWYLFPEQQIGRGLFESIIGKLKNLPQGELGEPFPPRAFITEETARLKQMRVALWDSEPSLADGGALALKMK